MKDRKLFIGGSDAPGILDLSRWATPLSVWADKVGLVEPKEPDTENMELGKELEDYVVKRFERKTGKKVIKRNTKVQHPKYDFIGGEVDGFIEQENAIFEAKTADTFKKKEWKDEDIPLEYIIQAQHYLACTGADKCYIAVLVGNHTFEWKIILPDKKVHKRLIETEVRFWNEYVKKKVPPSVTIGDKETLAEIYPESIDQLGIGLGDDADNIIELLEGMYADRKNLEKQIEVKENELKAILGNAEYGQTERYKVFWKTIKTSRLDSKKVKDGHPTVYKSCLKESSFRKFSYKKIKGEKDNGDNK